MTVRIDSDLLTALKEQAKHFGRSVSAEVVQLIQKQVKPIPKANKKSLNTAGMFSQFESPELEVFQEIRRTTSTQISLNEHFYEKAGS